MVLLGGRNKNQVNQSRVFHHGALCLYFYNVIQEEKTWHVIPEENPEPVADVTDLVEDTLPDVHVEEEPADPEEDITDKRGKKT